MKYCNHCGTKMLKEDVEFINGFDRDTGEKNITKLYHFKCPNKKRFLLDWLHDDLIMDNLGNEFNDFGEKLSDFD